jgi:hypothetical protein
MSGEPMPAGAITHIAGLDVQVGRFLRQRCAWCGAVLGDYDLACVAVLEGQNLRPAMWTVGALVAIDGAAAWAVEHEDGTELPANACAQLDPAVTL